MSIIKFYEITKEMLGYHITFDGDKSDLRLHSDDTFQWGAKLKRAYQKAEKLINKIEFKGEGWQIYAWCDVSGFDYWMKSQQETNYIQITIAFDTESIDADELPALKSAYDKAMGMAAEIADTYSFDPQFEVDDNDYR